MANVSDLVAARRLGLAAALALPAAALIALAITSGISRPASAAYPGVNGKIAFSTNRDGNSEIYVMEPDGAGQTRLTNTTASEFYPHWSPDGSKIAFDSARDGNFDLYVMNGDGSNQTRLTSGAGEDRQAAWSPDGAQMAFASNRSGAWQIYVMNADGSQQTQLTTSSGDNWGPAWSPDGATIAFGSTRAGYEVYVMNADGSKQTALTKSPANEAGPNWSPDGSKLVYHAAGDVYMMNADGSKKVNLTNNAAESAFPAWSPDGTRIVFQSLRDGNSELYVMNADGSAQTRIAGTGATEAMADWQPVCDASGCPTPVPLPSPTPCPKKGCPSPTKPPPATPTPPSPKSVPDFSILIRDAAGVSRCDSSSNPAAGCELPVGAPFTLDVNLDALPPALPPAGYAGFDARITFNGVTRATGGADPQRWPDCTYDAMYEQPGSIKAGCAINVQTQQPSQYTGVMLSFGFACTKSGTITLDLADVVDEQITKYVQSVDESLAITCAGGQSPDFSIRIRYSQSAARCDSSGRPTAKCQVASGAPFSLDVYLNALPAALPPAGYVGFDSAVKYTGVVRTPDSAVIHWPACVFDGRYEEPGRAAAGCAVGIGQPPSQYTGLMVTFGFVCSGSGTITLGMRDLVDAQVNKYVESGAESLEVSCVKALAFPGDTDADGCPDANEVKLDPYDGGQRDFLNPWDYFNPEKINTPHAQTIADILKVVLQYNKNLGNPGYTAATDRTVIPAAFPWTLGPPDDTQSVVDILAAVKQFNHNCP